MSRVVVTGAAGFIGSNIVEGLNARGIDDIVAVDDLTQGDKFRNLADLRIADYVDAGDFYERFSARQFGKVDAVFHQGACSDTMEPNGKYMMENNYSTSCRLYLACQEQATRLLFASSAAVYGGSDTFKEAPEFERPLNVYGWSKLLFDQRLRRELGSNLEMGAHQVVGFRYFNVYGPREQHKGRMASVAFHQFNQFANEGKVRLFGAYDGRAAGEQRRDFVHVSDVVAVNLWFFERPQLRGIFNLGTGRAQPFNDVALATLATLMKHPELRLEEALSSGLLEYVDFPEALRGKYQSYTQADISRLRAVGYEAPFHDVQSGVTSYVLSLTNSQPS